MCITDLFKKVINLTMSLKSGRDRDFQAKEGGMAGLTEKMGGTPLFSRQQKSWGLCFPLKLN